MKCFLNILPHLIDIVNRGERILINFMIKTMLKPKTHKRERERENDQLHYFIISKTHYRKLKRDFLPSRWSHGVGYDKKKYCI